MNDAFYAGSESSKEFLRFTPDTIEKHLKATYELRSKFLHEGTQFGSWVSFDHEGSEIQMGTPAYGEEKWKKLIASLPTLTGFERIIRFGLLRFIHQRISKIHPLLD